LGVAKQVRNKVQMNILIISNALPFPPHDGDRLTLYNLIKNLSDSHGIDLLTLLDHPNLGVYTENVGRYCDDLVAVPAKQNYPVYSKMYYHLSLFPYIVVKKYSIQMAKLVENKIRKNEYDIIHFHNFGMLPYGLNIRSLPKIAYVIDAVSLYFRRNYYNEKNLIKKFSYLIELVKMNRYEKKIYPRFDRCVVVSETDKLALQQNCPAANIITIPNGVDTEYFNSTSQSEEGDYLSLLFSGNMNYPPNVHAVLWFVENVWPRVKVFFPRLKLYIVGRNPSPSLERLKADKHIIITGYVEDIRPYFDRASIYICPMISGTGIKTKLLEAMAMRKPIIASSLSLQGIPDSKDNDCLLISDTPSDFSEKVIGLLENHNYRQNLGMAARHFVSDLYSWKNSAKMLEQTYKDAIDGFR